MNISPLTIYLWQLADKAATAATVLAWGFVALSFVSYVCSTYPGFDDETQDDETQAKARNTGFRFLIASAVTLLFYTLIPSSNTVAMMVVIPEIAHSKVIQNDLPDIYNAAVEALKAALKK